MLKTALKKVRSYLLTRKWDGYLVILPTSFLADKFIEELLTDEGPQGALQPRIYTFEGFVDMILTSSGSSTIWIGEIEKNEVLRTTIAELEHRQELHYFRNVEKHPGITQAITQTIGELKRAVILPDTWKRTTALFDSPKIHDLGLIYQSYQQILVENNLGDRDDRYLQALHLLTENQVTWLAKVDFAYIDWFEDPTGVQTEVFRLIKHKVPGTLINTGGSDEKVPRLPEIHLLKGWGREGEVRQIAGLIKKMVQEEGLGLNEIALVCRDPAIYSAELRRVFTEAGIPWCLDWKEPLSENRIGQSLFIFLQVVCAKEDFKLGELLDNTYLTGPSNQVKECLADWSRVYFRSDVPGWLDSLERAKPEWVTYFPGTDWESCYNWLKRFIGVINDVCQQGRITEIINSIRSTMEKLAVEKNILDVPEDLALEDKIILVRRDLRAWQAFNGILNEMEAAARILGNEEMELQAFCQQLWSYMGSEHYIPDIVCQGGVQILAPTQIRGLQFTNLIVLGMQEGVFPRSINSDWVINDAERLELRPEINLSTSHELYQREKILMQMVKEACQKRLWLSYPAVDEDGQEVLPSLFIEEMARLVDQPLEVEEPFPVVFPDEWQNSCSLRELELSLLHHGYRNAAYQLMGPKGLDKHVQALSEVNSRRWGSSFSPWDGCFQDADIIKKLRKKQSNRVFNISNLNTYVKCPLKYYLAAELGLKPLLMEETGINPLDKGMLQHQVLQRAFAEKLPDDDYQITNLINDLLEEVCKENNCLGQQYPHPSLWEFEKKAMRDSLTNLVCAEIKRLNQGNYQPAFQEWGFGMQGEDLDKASVNKPLLIDTSSGTIRLRGKVDRIDKNADGDSYVVYDYKNKTVESRAKILQGRALQLPAYLMAVETYLGKADGAAYINIAKGKVDSALVKTDVVQQLGLGRQTKSLTEEEWEQGRQTFVNVIDNCYTGINNGYFPPLPEDCDYCEFGGLCLFSPGRIRTKLNRKEVAGNES